MQIKKLDANGFRHQDSLNSLTMSKELDYEPRFNNRSNSLVSVN